MSNTQKRRKDGGSYVPCTPAGTPCQWLAAPTAELAWANLLRDAAHMPYRGIDGFKQRGYTVEFWKEPQP